MVVIKIDMLPNDSGRQKNLHLTKPNHPPIFSFQFPYFNIYVFIKFYIFFVFKKQFKKQLKHNCYNDINPNIPKNFLIFDIRHPLQFYKDLTSYYSALFILPKFKKANYIANDIKTRRTYPFFYLLFVLFGIISMLGKITFNSQWTEFSQKYLILDYSNLAQFWRFYTYLFTGTESYNTSIAFYVFYIHIFVLYVRIGFIHEAINGTVAFTIVHLAVLPIAPLMTAVYIQYFDLKRSDIRVELYYVFIPMYILTGISVANLMNIPRFCLHAVGLLSFSFIILWFLYSMLLFFTPEWIGPMATFIASILVGLVVVPFSDCLTVKKNCIRLAAFVAFCAWVVALICNYDGVAFQEAMKGNGSSVENVTMS